MSVNVVNSSTGALSPIAGGTLYADSPVGTIQAYGGATAPTGQMLCQGQALSRTTYADLFAVIGTSFGAGDGSTTFNIPDLRGEFLRGAGTNSHSDEGSGGTVGAHQDATKFTTPWVDTGSSQVQIASLYTTKYGAANPDKASYTENSIKYSTLTGTTKDGGNWLVWKTRPTNTSVNYIIKVTKISLPTDFSDAVNAAINAKIAAASTIYDANPNSIHYIKFGKMVIVSGVVTVSEQTAAHTTFITGLPPLINAYLGVDAEASTVTNNTHQYMRSGGSIESDFVTEASSYYLHFSYITSQA